MDAMLKRHSAAVKVLRDAAPAERLTLLTLVVCPTHRVREMQKLAEAGISYRTASRLVSSGPPVLTPVAFSRRR
jgi:hypothetical protein